MRSFVEQLRRRQDGGAAVEYALIMPILITLLVGGLCAGQLAFAVNGLHYAVQDAARCAAVKTTVCNSDPATVTYAQGRYSGPQIAPVFNSASGACGHMVSASATYPIILAAATINVPLTAAACFP